METVYLKQFFSMCNGLDIQLWCFSMMFKQNIGVANTRDETDEYMIENCHNGCHKRYECHKGDRLSIYSLETWKPTARDRRRWSSARHPGDVGPSMNHVEQVSRAVEAAGDPPEGRSADV